MNNDNFNWGDNTTNLDNSNNSDNGFTWGAPTNEKPFETQYEGYPVETEQNNPDNEPPNPFPASKDIRKDVEWAWNPSESDSLKEHQFISEESGESLDQLTTENYQREYSQLGTVNSLQINTELFHLNFDIKSLESEIERIGLEPLDDDGKYKLKSESPIMSRVLTSIKQLGEDRNLELKTAFIYKVKPDESVINIFRGSPRYNFIYFIKANHKSGDIILDLSSINGPSQEILDGQPNILAMLPGWVPYRIGKNKSKENLYAIAGSFA